METLIRSLETFFFTAKGLAYIRRYHDDMGEATAPLVIEALSKLDALAPLDQQLEKIGASWSTGKKLTHLPALAKAHLARFSNVPVSRDWSMTLLRNLLLDLRTRSFLVSRDEFIGQLEKITHKNPIRPGISAFGITTRNRPAALKRALDSYLAHFQSFQRQPRVIIADVSTTDNDRQLTRSAVDEMSRKYGVPIEYIGNEERKNLLDKYSDGSAEKRRALEFCLQGVPGVGHTYGLSRNMLMLAARGERIFSVDDDSICNTFRSKDYKKEMVFSRGRAATDSQVIIRYPDRAAAMATLNPVSVDILAAHEAVLGKPQNMALLDLMKSDSEARVSGMNNLSADGIKSGSHPILFSFTGLVGDSGSGTGLDFLYNRNVRSGKYQGDPQGLNVEMRSREITKTSDEYRILSDGPCMTIFYGLDNSYALPPFFPHFRMEDQLFKDMVKKIRGDAKLAYVPFVLEHSPIEERKNESIFSGHSVSFTMQEIISAIMDETVGGIYPEEDFMLGRKTLAKALTNFAEQPYEIYKRHLTDLLMAAKWTRLADQRSALKECEAHLPKNAVEEINMIFRETEKQLNTRPKIAEMALNANPQTSAKSEEMTRQMIIDMAHALVWF